jgi:hypothetical protein
LKLKKGDDPVFMRSGNMVVCGWHDTKRLTMLSSVDTNLTIDKEIRSKEHPSGKRTVEKPVAVWLVLIVLIKCWAHMTYQYPHKSLKWYHTLYHRTIEVPITFAQYCILFTKRLLKKMQLTHRSLDKE